MDSGTGDNMKVTFFGTTTLLFDDGRDQILFDCHFTRPSLFSYFFAKASINTKLADSIIEKYGINRLRAIFVSHSHHDHVLDAPYVSNATGAIIYGTASTLNVGRGAFVPAERLIEFHPDETYDAGDFRVTVLASKHSKMLPFVDDVGETIDQPLKQPAYCRQYKEGGSYDFLVEHEGKKILIRPSFSYVKGELDHIQADVLFLGIAGLDKEDEETERIFYDETIEKVKPELVIPLHWDNFFKPLEKPAGPFMGTDISLLRLERYCGLRRIKYRKMEPLASMEI